MRHALRLLAAFVAAVAATTVLGTVVQTQFNLAALQSLGAPMPWDVRLSATGHDLIGFTPAFAPIVAGGFVVAFALAGLVLRWLRLPRAAFYALGGGCAIAAALVAMNLTLPVTAIAAARGAFGFAALVLAGATGGWLFAALSARPATG